MHVTLRAFPDKHLNGLPNDTNLRANIIHPTLFSVLQQATISVDDDVGMISYDIKAIARGMTDMARDRGEK